jgi:iron complex outermembrane receptor protein
VRLPTFTDLYLQNSIQKADPNLLPEKSTTIEAGVKYDKLGLRLNGAAFYRIGKNVIDWVRFTPTSKWESKNLADINTFGVDASAEYLFKNVFLKKITLSYSYLSLNKEAVAFDSKYALDYLRHKAVLSVNHIIVSKLSAQWKASYNERAGDYVDFVSAAKTLYKPFTMVDIRLVWTDRYYDVFVDGNNLLNVTYADYGGLVQPRINFNVGVRVKL